MKFKKILALSIVSAMIGSVLVTGCGTKEKETTSTETTKKQEETKAPETEKKTEPLPEQNIEFWTMQLSPTFDAYLNDVIAKFQTENPNIKVKWVDVPWGDMEKKIMAAAASNGMPDVANLNPHFAQKLAQLNALADMETLASDVKGDYFTGTWNASQFNGKTFGLPWYLTNGITFYNKDLFEKAGLDVNKAPQTYEEMYDFAKAVKEKTGKYGFFVSFKDQIGMEAFEQAGVRLFNDDFTKATFTSSEAVERAKFFKRLIDEGLMPKDVLTEGTGKAIQMYSSGELAMFQGGTSHAGMIEKNNKEVYDKTGVGPQLVNANGKSNVAVMNVCVSEASKNKEAAVKFAKFLTNEKNQVEFAKVSGAIIPSTKGSIADAFFTNTSGTTKDLARAISAKQMDQASVIFPPIKNFNDVKNAFMEAAQKILSGAEEPEKALKAAEDTANAALAK